MASEWIGDVATAVVAAAGIGYTYLAGARGRDQVDRMALASRKHERTMAREAREQERLADAYVQLLGMMERIGQWVQQVNPMYQSNPDRPLPDLDKQADVVAAMRAYGSDEVVEAFEAW